MNCLMIHGSEVHIRVFERLGKKYVCVLKGNLQLFGVIKRIIMPLVLQIYY